ncbi:MAG: DNA polymerase I [Lachnospiraceae bacterium]|nr:DNA polymerase I [Lachnospiraceae bacterium]
MRDKLLLIDGHSILNRAFYGMPPLTNQKGVHTGAVLGFLNIVLPIIEQEEAKYLAVAFDVHAKTFRHEMYEAYKGTRKPMPEDLREQVPLIKEVLHAMQIPTVEQAGLEADDILGTLAKKGQAEGLEVAILSGDRDLLQIADEHIKIKIPHTKNGTTTVDDFYAADVQREWQMTPKQFIELKALMGDTADNIPGVPKVGQKTATDLMLQYGSLQGIYDHLDEITKKSIHDSLAENRELADLSLKLATIKIDCDLPVTIHDVAIHNFYTDEAYQMFSELEFKKLLGRFEEARGKEQPFAYEYFATFKDVEAYLNRGGENLALYLQGAGDTYFGLALTGTDGKTYVYIPASAVMGALGIPQTTAELQKLCRLACKHFEKVVTYDLKAHMGLFLEDDASFDENRFEDVKLLGYLLNPLKSDVKPEDLAITYLNRYLEPFEKLFPKKKPEDVTGEETFALYLAKRAESIAKLYPDMLLYVKDQGMDKLYYELELPLTKVLYDMEQEGVLIVPEELKEYSSKLGTQIETLEQDIYRLAGETFTINSPKQLGEILFGKLQLPGGKKTKTGYSTAADVLEKLAPENEIVAKVLEYRGLSKLKSTYADALTTYVDAENRIHTTFNQTVTATGRLSSSDPNLQNIPMRTEAGRLIRKVFVAKPGYLLVDADYSQIELRVLASLSGDQALIDAYRQDSDIHRLTASKVFHVAPEEVTPLMRRNAKAVNFGIVYGISAFGLGQDLSISQKEAKEYIDAYFELYPGIKAYLDGCVEFAKEKGYTESLFGRRRPMDELKSSNFMQRSFGERVAKNAPIQGTAADIIKIAMLHVAKRLEKEGLESKLILQIHDELLVEAKESEVEQVQQILKEEMEHAADLAVNLEIDMHVADNWYDAH